MELSRNGTIGAELNFLGDDMAALGLNEEKEAGGGEKEGSQLEAPKDGTGGEKDEYVPIDCTPVRWLPTEVWVDIFKLLSRRTLCRIQGSCRRFLYIAEDRVDVQRCMRRLSWLSHNLAGSEGSRNHLLTAIDRAREHYAILDGNYSVGRHIRLCERFPFWLWMGDFETGDGYQRQILFKREWSHSHLTCGMMDFWCLRFMRAWRNYGSIVTPSSS